MPALPNFEVPAPPACLVLANNSSPCFTIFFLADLDPAESAEPGLLLPPEELVLRPPRLLFRLDGFRGPTDCEEAVPPAAAAMLSSN